MDKSGGKFLSVVGTLVNWLAGITVLSAFFSPLFGPVPWWKGLLLGLLQFFAVSLWIWPCGKVLRDSGREMTAKGLEVQHKFKYWCGLVLLVVTVLLCTMPFFVGTYMASQGFSFWATVLAVMVAIFFTWLIKAFVLLVPLGILTSSLRQPGQDSTETHDRFKHDDSVMINVPRLDAEYAKRRIIACLNDIEFVHPNDAFAMCRAHVLNLIHGREGELEAMAKKKLDFDGWCVGLVGNHAGDLLESGKFHFYRGAINPMGPGEDLLRLFDWCADEGVRTGSHTAEFAEKQKAQLRKNLNEVG